MSEAQKNPTDEKAATTENLRCGEKLERLLAEAERRLTVERDTMADLQDEVADKNQRLKAALAQVEDLHKQLDLLKVQSAKRETHVVRAEQRAGHAEEKVALLWQEMRKRLAEAAEEYKKSVSFDMDATIA